MKLIAVGRLKAGPERDLYERYAGRITPLAKQLGFMPLDVAELRESSASTVDQRKAAEADAIRTKLPLPRFLIAFDERGKNLSSEPFAYQLRCARDEGRVPTCIIGGPDGLDGSLRKEADLVLSFGAMTLPHQLVRVLIVEQLYRAMTLLAGHPYHRS
ncbi:MAG: 23S rRNA (pseudouridine(1915)-N(3))-methyltransferase RlmH [Pseudomonadota bacterium]